MLSVEVVGQSPFFHPNLATPPPFGGGQAKRMLDIWELRPQRGMWLAQKGKLRLREPKEYVCKARQLLKLDGGIQCLKEKQQGEEERQRAKERGAGEWVLGAQGWGLHLQASPWPGKAC